MAEHSWAAEVEAAGRSAERVAADRRRLAAPPPRVDVVRPCVLGDGIEPLPEACEASGRAAAGDAMAFVPASGAATRLFRAWREACEQGRVDAPGLDAVDRIPAWVAADGDPAPDRLAGLAATLEQWGQAPKGLVPFHAPERTAVDEHLAEARALGLAAVHFTVSAAHVEAFREATADAPLPVDLSVQDPRTDTLAFTPQLEPLRGADGQLVFRPSGHGALLGNLASAAEAAPGGLVAVKNIDNVVHPDHRGGVLPWRWRLLGRAAELRDARDQLLHDGDAAGARRLLADVFERTVPREEALAALDRPLRVAGVVRDDGEPGGGPYWVRGADGEVRAQIVEGAQLGDDDTAHQRARSAATHFNPVDMVLVVAGRHGPYDLQRFVDERGFMVVHKSHQGRPVVAVERPGLWNGAMAGWNTLFVELPAEVFQPVKAIADLLRPAHQPARDDGS